MKDPRRITRVRALTLVAVAARVVLAGVLLAAAVPKLLNPADFAVAVANYRMLPPLGVYVVALWLPWLEGLVALALLYTPAATRTGAWLAGIGLSALFFGVVAIAQARGLDIACGCFGGAGKITLLDLALRLTLLLGAMGGTWADRVSRRVDST